jgi:hypothetical protein
MPTDQVPRLGSAKIIVSINDREGLVVRHGSDPNVILASKPASKCGKDDWDRIWDTIDSLGVHRR